MCKVSYKVLMSIIRLYIFSWLSCIIPKYKSLSCKHLVPSICLGEKQPWESISESVDMWEKYLIKIYFPKCCMKVKATQPCLTLRNPMDCTVHGILQVRILEWVAFPFSKGSFQPRGWTQVSHIAGRFFTSWTTREAQEYWAGVGSLSLLQRIFPTQESNWNLLHCRRILYQLSY